MAAGNKREVATVAQTGEVKSFEGVFRKTLAYNRDLMLCRFDMKKGARIPMHKHEAAQIGYVVKGSLRFSTRDGSGFLAEAGTSYVFDSNQEHAAEVLADSEVVECFAPMRPDFV